MARTSLWPTLMGTAALIALPVLAAAQTGQASAGSQTPPKPTAQSDSKYPSTAGAAVQHLTEAKQVLDGIPRTAVQGRNLTKLNQIRREFAALQRSHMANPSPSASASSKSAAGTKGAARHWNTQLMALDRDLAALLGASETAGTSGTSTPEAPAGKASTSPSSSSLDPNVKSQLEEFRKHITEFAAAASGTQASGEMSSADTNTSPASAESSSTPAATTPTGTSETAQPSTPASQASPSSTSSSQTGSATGETAEAQTANSQVDAAAARQHLTEARQSLADMTALPQAQQLQGETRTQVSQLISQFNQLITTQDDWRASYEQVNATLSTLLSSGAASSSTSSSTQGAVGTSGSVTVDPAIRAKLEEFRTHLNAFYSSAGGSAAASSPTSSSAAAGSAATPTGSMPSSGSTAPPAASSTSATGSMGEAPSASTSSDAESHIDAIQRILDQASGSSSSAAGTSGAAAAPSGTSSSSITLTQQQIDQIKMHLQQLRASIKK